MDKEYLKDQIDYAQARIEELDKLLLNTESSTKGYKESIDAYNKWVDRHGELISLLEHFDDIDVDREKIALEKEQLEFEKEKLRVQQEIEANKQSALKEIEQNKLELEKDRQAIMQELEQDKINVENERLRLDREIFANDVKVQKREEIENGIFEVLELSVKIGVPVAVILAIVGVSKLAYVKEQNLELCNGRVYGGIKDLLSLARLAI